MTGREEWIEERAAILEYEADIPRGVAERMAKEMYERTYGDAGEER